MAAVRRPPGCLAKSWIPLLLAGAPLFVAASTMVLPESLLQKGIVAVVGVLLLSFLASRPGAAAVALIGGFTIAEIAFALLFKLGMPASVLRSLGYWDEGLVAALVIGAVRHRRKLPATPDVIDVLGISFVLLVALYWRFPGVFPPDAEPVLAEARNVAFRGLVAPVIGLLAIRHVELSAAWRRRCVAAAVFTGALMAAGAIVEVLAPGWWNSFAGFNIGMVPYRQGVFGSTRTSMLAYADFQSSKLQRAGSWFSDPLSVGFTYHLPLAVALAAVMARPRPGRMVLLGLATTGLLLTQGRAAMLGGIVILIAAFRRRDERSQVTPSKLGLALLAIGLIALPLLAGASLGQRFAGAINGDDDISAPDHLEQSTKALQKVEDKPLGHGLGLAGGNSRRFEVQDGVVSENHFLAIGIEVGVLGMALYVLLIGAVVRAGRRRSVEDGGGDILTFAAISALLATSVGGLFLHSLESPIVSVPTFITAGLALGGVRAERREPALSVRSG